MLASELSAFSIIGGSCHKYVCHDKTFVGFSMLVATKLLLWQTYFCCDKCCCKTCSSGQNFCCDKTFDKTWCDKTFVATDIVTNIILSRQKFCCNKHLCLLWQNMSCRDKHVFVMTIFSRHSKHDFVATKMILVAVPTIDSLEAWNTGEAFQLVAWLRQGHHTGCPLGSTCCPPRRHAPATGCKGAWEECAWLGFQLVQELGYFWPSRRSRQCVQGSDECALQMKGAESLFPFFVKSTEPMVHACVISIVFCCWKEHFEDSGFVHL